jgi:integrase/recombinase XerD
LCANAAIILTLVFMKNITITLKFDTRRKKKNGKYPVRLRIFDALSRRATTFHLKYEYTEEMYQEIKAFDLKQTGRLSEYKKQLREDRLKLDSAIGKAQDIVDNMQMVNEQFTFEKFRDRFEGTRGNKINVFFLLKKYKKELSEAGRISYAETFNLTINYLNRFHGSDNLTLYDITPEWLEKYERFMESEKKSAATIGIYIRNIRTVFNKAIKDRYVAVDFYPFGSERDGKYVIPESRNEKKALDESILLKLFKVETKTPEQERGKDFWFLSYSCSGMNMKDIALLRHENISDSTFSFIRAKTKRTKKKKQTKVEGSLSNHAKYVIQKYGAENKSGYIFNIINDRMSEVEKYRRIKNFTRSINQAIKKVAQSANIPDEYVNQISTYHARHSFSQRLIDTGASIEEVMESLGHSDPKTTKLYIKSFGKDSPSERNKKIMGFLEGN